MLFLCCDDKRIYRFADVLYVHYVNATKLLNMLASSQQQDRQDPLDLRKIYLPGMQSCEKTIIINHAVKKHPRPNMI